MSGVYFTDFTNHLDGWQGYAENGGAIISNSEFICEGRPGHEFIDDHNQEIAVGTQTIVCHRTWQSQRPDGSFSVENFLPGRLLTARIKFENWQGPAGMRLLPWAQARIPGTGPNWKYSDWAMTGFDDSGLFDGQWHEISALYSDDPAWTYADGPPETYAYAPLDVTLANICNILLIVTRPIGTPKPTGTFRMDWIKLSAAA